LWQVDKVKRQHEKGVIFEMGLTTNKIGAFIIMKEKYDKVLQERGVEKSSGDAEILQSVIDSNNDIFDIMKECNELIYSLKFEGNALTEDDCKKIKSIKEMFQQGIDAANEVITTIDIILA